MSVWSEGYVTDIPYTNKVYAELAPGFLAFACARQGVRPPRLGRGARYLELGCGQGYGLALLAAANPALDFVGIDFNPAHVASARRLAAAAGLDNVAFEDLSFRQVLDLPAGGLGRFEVVVLHGVYSWVSAENRAAIVEILDRAVAPGGLVYVSYNALPGWAATAPLQRFVRDHAARHPGEPQAQVVAALKAAQALIDAKAAFFDFHPSLKSKIAEALNSEPAYLAHEYLNAEVHPLYHADMVRDFDAARLAYVASANLAEDLVNLAAPAPMQPIIQATADRVWRETLADYASAKAFRRDIFIRGREQPTALEREQILFEARLALLVPPEACVFEYPVPVGTLKGQPGIYGPIVEALAMGPMTYGAIRRLPALSAASDSAVLQAVAMMVGGRQIHPAALAFGDAAPAQRFNRAVAAQAAVGEASTHLAAPLTGSGVRVEFTELVAAAAALNGESPEAAARAAWPIMARTGRRLVQDGQVLQDEAANQAELARRIAEFNRAKLPLYKALGVV
jgi:SAM-dependent methyltransferase